MLPHVKDLESCYMSDGIDFVVWLVGQGSYDSTCRSKCQKGKRVTGGHRESHLRRRRLLLFLWRRVRDGLPFRPFESFLRVEDHETVVHRVFEFQKTRLFSLAYSHPIFSKRKRILRNTIANVSVANNTLTKPLANKSSTIYPLNPAPSLSEVPP